jgi:hypothetical protein
MTPQPTNSFSEYYKTISDAELLSILENTDEYQQAAIEAAKQELERRQLAVSRLEHLKNELARKKYEEEQVKQRLQHVERTIREKLSNTLEILNPIQTEIADAERILRFIIILWGLLAAYQTIHDHEIELQSVREFPYHPFLNTVILLPYIVLPVSIYYLWKRKPLGWTLFVVYLTVQLLAEVSALYYALNWRPTGIQWMDKLTKPSLPKILLLLVFVGGTLYAVSLQKLRSLFFIEQKKMFLTVGITIVVSFLVYVGLMNQ